MSALRTIEDLFDITKEKYNITIFGDEPHYNYNRIMLSYLLSGEKTFEETIINHKSWYDEHNVTLNKGDKVIAIDKEAKEVT